MRIVFMGTPDYATTIFLELKSSFDIVAIFTQPDKPVGRKKVLTPPHIKKYCLYNNIEIPIYQPKTLKDLDVKEQIKSLNPDFIVVAAYGQILPKDILDMAPCINLHASILPKYRGASPIQDIFLNDEKFTGVTSMLMDVGLDSGDILAISYVDVTSDDDVGTMFNKLSQVASSLSVKTINNFSKIAPLKQNHQDATHCKKIKKSDGLVNFGSAKKIYSKYLAYKYWPNIFLDSKLKLKDIQLNELDSKNRAGEIISIEKDFAVIGCEKGSIKVYKVQPESKKEMDINSYLRGKRLLIEDTLS